MTTIVHIPFIMTLNIENLVRSAAVVIVGLPVSLGFMGALGTADRLTTLAEEAAAKNAVAEQTDTLKGKLAEPCLRYVVSKADSKLEREAKDAIDEVLGGEVNYKSVCDWVL